MTWALIYNNNNIIGNINSVIPSDSRSVNKEADCVLNCVGVNQSEDRPGLISQSEGETLDNGRCTHHSHKSVWQELNRLGWIKLTWGLVLFSKVDPQIMTSFNLNQQTQEDGE